MDDDFKFMGLVTSICLVVVGGIWILTNDSVETMVEDEIGDVTEPLYRDTPYGMTLYHKEIVYSGGLYYMFIFTNHTDSITYTSTDVDDYTRLNEGVEYSVYIYNRGGDISKVV